MSKSPMITIQGLLFPFHPRYRAGHILSDIEANVINSALIDALRNNFASRIKAFRRKVGRHQLTADELAELRGEYEVFAAHYKFSKAAPSAAFDPTLALARDLALDAIHAHLRKNGISLSYHDSAWYESRVAAVLDSDPKFLEEARRRIELAQKVTKTILSDSEESAA